MDYSSMKAVFIFMGEKQYGNPFCFPSSIFYNVLLSRESHCNCHNIQLIYSVQYILNIAWVCCTSCWHFPIKHIVYNNTPIHLRWAGHSNILECFEQVFKMHWNSRKTTICNVIIAYCILCICIVFTVPQLLFYVQFEFIWCVALLMISLLLHFF